MNERCDRFEREGWADGEALIEDRRAHLDTCPDCQDMSENYRLLGRDLKRMSARYVLRPQLRARVREAVERGEAPRASTAGWPWWARAGFAVAAIAASVVPFMVVSPKREPQLKFEVFAGASIVRAIGHARVGDRLKVLADRGWFPHAELRIYHERTALMLRCPRDPECRSDRGGITSVEITLKTPGLLKMLWLTSEQELFDPTSSIDRDVEAATKRGIVHRLRELEVR